MKKIPAPALLLGVLYLFFAGYLVLSASQLPDRVATHFDAGGQPNAWMSRSSLLAFMAVFGFAFPLYVVGLSFIARIIPDKWQNIPRREYWLAPERRNQTFAYVLRHSFWFACMALCFVTGIYFSVIQANQHHRPHLSAPLIILLAMCFLAGTLFWGLRMIRHFRRGE